MDYFKEHPWGQNKLVHFRRENDNNACQRQGLDKFLRSLHIMSKGAHNLQWNLV